MQSTNKEMMEILAKYKTQLITAPYISEQGTIKSQVWIELDDRKADSSGDKPEIVTP